MPKRRESVAPQTELDVLRNEIIALRREITALKQPGPSTMQADDYQLQHDPIPWQTMINHVGDHRDAEPTDSQVYYHPGGASVAAGWKGVGAAAVGTGFPVHIGMWRVLNHNLEETEAEIDFTTTLNSDFPVGAYDLDNGNVRILNGPGLWRIAVYASELSFGSGFDSGEGMQFTMNIDTTGLNSADTPTGTSTWGFTPELFGTWHVTSFFTDNDSNNIVISDYEGFRNYYKMEGWIWTPSGSPTISLPVRANVVALGAGAIPVTIHSDFHLTLIKMTDNIYP